MKRIKYIIIMIFFTILLLVNLFPLLRYMYNAKQQSDYYKDIASYVNVDATRPAETIGKDPDDISDGTEPVVEETLPPILPQYQELYDMNPDIVGWLKIEDTQINYPVMQSPEEEADFYIDHDFNGNKTFYGCLYVQELCDVNKPSDNITIYGHNITDGSMFNGLHRYKQEEYWEEHRFFTFDTIREQHEYEIFAVFKTSEYVNKNFYYHMFMDAENEEDFNTFVSKCKELSYYDTGITPKYGDKLVCLSTCEYSYYNGRLVVVGVRVD